LANFVPIRFATPTTQPDNFVDAAIAECDFADISREVYWIGYPRDFDLVKVGDIVVKTGARTGFTTGKVTAVNVTTFIGPYPEGLGNAKFVGQVFTTSMSDRGDSGSLVCNRAGWTVGLLFAGSNVVSVFHPIELVLRALGIRISADPQDDLDP
jgi:hypothetical protein